MEIYYLLSEEEAERYGVKAVPKELEYERVIDRIRDVASLVNNTENVPVLVVDPFKRMREYNKFMLPFGKELSLGRKDNLDKIFGYLRVKKRADESMEEYLKRLQIIVWETTLQRLDIVVTNQSQVSKVLKITADKRDPDALLKQLGAVYALGVQQLYSVNEALTTQIISKKVKRVYENRLYSLLPTVMNMGSKLLDMWVMMRKQKFEEVSTILKLQQKQQEINLRKYEMLRREESRGGKRVTKSQKRELIEETPVVLEMLAEVKEEDIDEFIDKVDKMRQGNK